MPGRHSLHGLFRFMPDAPDTIAENALKPTSVTIDGNSASLPSPSEQIKADKYAGSENAMSEIANGGWFIRRKFNPPSARGDTCDV